MDILLKGGRGERAGLLMQGEGIFTSKGVRDCVFQQDMLKIHTVVVGLLKYMCPDLMSWQASA
jgi:hypothetical protein